MKLFTQFSNAVLAATLALLAACGATPTSQVMVAPTLATTGGSETHLDAATTTGGSETHLDTATAGPPQPTPTFAPPTADYRQIADTLAKPIREAYPGTPVLVGVLGQEGDDAAALASPFGDRPQFAFLQRTAEAWKTIFVGSTPSGQQLTQAGVPESLMSASDAYAVIDVWMAQLQDPKGAGVDGYLEIEGIAGDYARGQFTPSDPAKQDGFTAFFKRENDRWKQLTAGTAFMPDDLQQLGVPKSLWPTAQP